MTAVVTCCRLFGVKGRSVETWNMISYSPSVVYNDSSPAESAIRTHIYIENIGLVHAHYS